MDSQRSDERGYAMAVLLVGIAIMMVFLGAAMPVWNQQAKREREEELLFRLKQYAHAITLYQRRLPGAQPPSIDVLVEQRFLRRRYKDPMTGKDFALLRVGQVSPGMTTPLPGMTVPMPGSPQRAAPPQGVGQTSRGSGGPSGTRPRGGIGPGNQAFGGGAIRGVVSTSTDSSLRIWKGRTRYDQWEVTPEDIVPRFMPVQGNPDQPGQGGPGQGGPGQPGRSGPGQMNPGQLGPGGGRPGGPTGSPGAGPYRPRPGG